MPFFFSIFGAVFVGPDEEGEEEVEAAVEVSVRNDGCMHHAYVDS